MSGIYLASYKAFHPGYKILYQDINGKRDLPGDMLDYNLNDYDFVIASPPCNYYSRSNWRRNESDYALNTKHLLPGILNKLRSYDKPWIVENVRNKPIFQELGLYDLPCFIYEIGRHTYWTNILLNPYVFQEQENIHFKNSSTRQGGLNVHNVIESFLSYAFMYHLIPVIDINGKLDNFQVSRFFDIKDNLI